MKKVKQGNISISLHRSLLIGTSTYLNLADSSVEDIWQTLNTEIANEEQSLAVQRMGFVIVDNTTNEALACEDFGEYTTAEQREAFLLSHVDKVMEVSQH